MWFFGMGGAGMRKSIVEESSLSTVTTSTTSTSVTVINKEEAPRTKVNQVESQVASEIGMFEEVTGGVTAPRGYKAAGVYCGIRKIKKDLALITSDVPAAIGAVFTLNRTQAAPIIVNKAQLKKTTTCTAIIVNSGNANACTGERGLNDAWTMVKGTAAALNIPEEQVIIASTGVIGQYLPIEKISNGIRIVAEMLSEEGSNDAATAIMTTDTFYKEYAVKVTLPQGTFTIGGIAKGSGMIAPNMATMLGFITTDVAIPQPLLQKIFTRSIDISFNRISVDGDMSTNDMATVMANGMSGVEIKEDDAESIALFTQALDQVQLTLAKMIARDGEGATKLVEVLVTGAKSENEALAAARSVANSNLVKTAIHGKDANWGRIIAAVGYSGIEFSPDNLELSMNDLPILNKNYEIVLDEEKAKIAFLDDEIKLKINLNQGKESACFWTCDLSKEYVHSSFLAISTNALARSGRPRAVASG